MSKKKSRDDAAPSDISEHDDSPTLDTPGESHEDNSVSEPTPSDTQNESDREVYEKAIADVIFSKGLGHSVETCLTLARDIFDRICVVENPIK